MTSRSEMMHLIRQVHLRFGKYFSRKFAKSSLTHSQHMLLMCLLEEGAQQMNALANSLHISTPAVTNLVDKLERGGYAKRLPHSTDRRAHIIDLTPSGRKLVGSFRAESLKLLADTIGTMSDKDRLAVEKFYGILHDRLGKELEARNSQRKIPNGAS
jgi:DNA-binding MarR family transcriptional regulator